MMEDSLHNLTSHYMSLSGWGAGSHGFATSDSKIGYYPLSIHRNEIRLLIIEPAISPDDHLRCRLDYVSLDDTNNDFVALSYTWGGTEPSSSNKHVLLNDRWIAVTTNLHRALSDLRSRRYLTVWADSLCINQHDLEERSQMVLRMGVIYRSAKMVVSFLGTNDPSDLQRAALVSHFIPRVLHELKTWKPIGKDGKQLKGYTGRNLESRMATFTDEMCSTAVSGLRIEDTERLALIRLLHHEYWYRAWIIQEISMNTRLQIIWAQSVFDLGDLAIALRALSLVSGIGSSEPQRHIQQLADIRKSQLELKSLSLVEALYRCSQAQASLPRDRLYALLGLTHDGAKLVPFPSYEMEMGDISRDITRRMIQATGKVDLIVLKYRNQNHNTWYTDWFLQETWVNRSSLNGPCARPNWAQPDSRGPHYRASGDEKAQFEFRGTHATFKGFLLGPVSSCSPTLEEAKASGVPDTHISNKTNWKWLNTEPGSSFSSSTHITKSLRWLLVDFTTELQLDSFQNSSKDISSLGRVINGDRKLRKPAPVSEPRRAFGLLHKLLSKRKKEIRQHAPYLMQWMNCCNKESFEINGQPFVGYFSQENDKHSTPPRKFKTVCQNFQSNLEAGMRLGNLNNADLLGWFPMDTKKGDEVVVLLGASMPCVIRRMGPLSSFYSLIGPCYIDGVMDGELVKKGMRELQDVALY
ncbi:heterokaryon incompatibility protein-domain-containing protein [Xylariaceae sp. FL0255]|nr:heterokaryon incompatibility protein-domain-containing protein [Xylariaceae sp. FL0255]